MEKHYSGKASKKFWQCVKRLELDLADHDRVYRMGCVLQNLEELVLEDLSRCEQRRPEPKLNLVSGPHDEGIPFDPDDMQSESPANSATIPNQVSLPCGCPDSERVVYFYSRGPNDPLGNRVSCRIHNTGYHGGFTT